MINFDRMKEYSYIRWSTQGKAIQMLKGKVEGFKVSWARMTLVINTPDQKSSKKAKKIVGEKLNGCVVIYKVNEDRMTEERFWYLYHNIEFVKPEEFEEVRAGILCCIESEPSPILRMPIERKLECLNDVMEERKKTKDKRSEPMEVTKQPRLEKADILMILQDIECADWRFHVDNMADGYYIQVRYDEPDVNTGIVEEQRSRKWYTSSYSTRSEVIQTCLKAVLTSAEHRVREAFKYKGEMIYGPHLNAEQLYDLVKSGRAVEERIPLTV